MQKQYRLHINTAPFMTLAALLLFVQVVVGDIFSLLKPLSNVISCLVQCKMNNFVTLTYYLNCYFISRPLARHNVKVTLDCRKR